MIVSIKDLDGDMAILYYYLVDTEINNTENCACKNYWGMLFTMCTEGVKFILVA